MSTTLAATISATDRSLSLSGDTAGTLGGLYAIEDEIVRLDYFAPSSSDPNAVNKSVWHVSRGMENTAAVGHDSGTAVYATRSEFAVAGDLVVPSPTVAPTLAEVYAAGGGALGAPYNGASAVSIVAPNGPQGETNAGVRFELWAGSAATGLGGGNGADLWLYAGDGYDAEDTPFAGAAIEVRGGAANKPGRLFITTGDAQATKGDVLGHVSGDTGTVVWSQLVTTATSSPVGETFTSILVADTTGKKLYGWTGTDYVQIGAWS